MDSDDDIEFLNVEVWHIDVQSACEILTCYRGCRVRNGKLKFAN